MARYIDADKAKQEFNIGFGGVSHAVIANQIIDSIPTADVVEVKHGEWVPYNQPYGFGYSIPGYKPTHYCSNCNGLGWEFYTICPSCGAKMDGSQNK